MMRASRFSEEQIFHLLQQAERGEEAEEVIEAWREEYNAYRPHSALGGVTPRAFEASFAQLTAARERTG
jgi:transposase InsO family protein